MTGEPEGADKRAMAGHCEDADLSALEGLKPHEISPTHEFTLDAAFLLIHELQFAVAELKRRVERLKNG